MIMSVLIYPFLNELVIYYRVSLQAGFAMYPQCCRYHVQILVVLILIR
jgi:hypothetical protein